MLTWMRDIIELVFHVTLWNNVKEMCGQFVHSTWPSRAIWESHPPTFKKWHKKKKKNEKVTLYMLTHGAMQGCGLTSLVVCINDKFH